ncbi:transmembrane emp24 domain-containing protein p24delta5-like [Carica papaya]|uniref:transmembrane emp24 domain-containing protein p24delta5-like n=1 Tax=Carica papaya TaxID=3649 RepID=UPI000B8CF83B|nr:transmembrane emp24 domain-containing protein p24delta5-like [Carica papaya]
MVKGSLSGFHVGVLSLIFLCLTISDKSNLVPVAEALWLTIPSTGSKCVSEEIRDNVVVLGSYHVFDDDHPESVPKISARVTSPYGKRLYEIQNVSYGDFAFTSQEAGEYMACFWTDASREQTTPVSLGLNWRIGVDAKDWASIAKKEKIEGVELQLRKLEELVNGIHDRLLYFKLRELRTREMSEAANWKVARFSIMSIGVCIVASILQLWHLKRYFVKKRLI